ncbi:MAG: OmpA family protein [Planktomarina sp.]
MNKTFSKLTRGVAIAVGALAISLSAVPAFAHQTTGTQFAHTHSDQTRTVTGERYVPTIWVDPDGCEHWVMDDGWEGFMTPKLTREGLPTCRGAQVCGVMGSDALFATNSYRLSWAAKNQLMDFFRQNGANSYIISGHTDARASDAYNLRLSRNRANAVANVARSVGANVSEIRGLGERQPVATNSTQSGMARNRRVEIICVN